MRLAILTLFILLLPVLAAAQPTSENYGFVNYSIGGAYQSASASSSNYGYDQETGGRYVYEPTATTSTDDGGGGGGGSSEPLTEEEEPTSGTSTEDTSTSTPDEEEPEPEPEPGPEPTPDPSPVPADSGEESEGIGSGDGDGGGGSAASLTEEEARDTENSSERTQVDDQDTDQATSGTATSDDDESSSVLSRVTRTVFPDGAAEAVENTVETVRRQARKLEPIIRPVEPLRQPAEYSGITWGVLSAMFASSKVPFALSNLWHLLTHGWVYLLGFVSTQRRRRPWGTVYDSVTKAPLDPAYVELLYQDGSEVTDAITDLDGRYGFVAPEGNYVMHVKKSNYVFPSKRQEGTAADALYDELYFGEPFHAAGAVNKNIPMDPLEFDWNQFEKLRTKQTRFYHRFDHAIYVFFNVVFYLGAAFAFWQFLVRFDLLTFGLFFIYILIIVYRFIYGGPILYGTLSRGDRPVPYAVVRVLRDGVEIQRKVADQYGRYVAIVSPGTYEVQVDEQVNEDEYETVYETTVKAKRGIINSDLTVPA